MDKKDVRWVQRFSNFLKAFHQLKEAIDLSSQRQLSNLEIQGFIQAFEYTHELAWKTLKNFLENRGHSNIYGSKDAVRESFKAGLIENGEVWMEMIKSRNLASHTYDESFAEELTILIKEKYYDEFLKFRKSMEDLKQNEDL